MILIDTHVLLWWASQQKDRISMSAGQAIEAEQKSGQVAISSISAWEITMLIQRNRIALTMGTAEWFATVGQAENVCFIPVDNAIVIESESLPGDFHSDPADRMIVATARRLGASLVTMDEKIRNYPHVRTIW